MESNENIHNINEEEEYHPEFGAIINKELLEMHHELIEDIFCSNCNQIVKLPEKCIECKLTKCKKCKPKCSHSSYVVLENNLLSSLMFKCDLGCEEEIPFYQIYIHHQNQCSKLTYKKEYNKLKEQIIQLKKENRQLEIENNSRKKQYSHLLIGIKNNTITTKSVRLSYHKHTLQTINNLHRFLWNCQNCHKSFSRDIISLNCKNCNYDICMECFITEILEKKTSNK